VGDFVLVSTGLRPVKAQFGSTQLDFRLVNSQIGHFTRQLASVYFKLKIGDLCRGPAVDILVFRGQNFRGEQGQNDYGVYATYLSGHVFSPF
jgi:hypothetical protein